MKKEKPKKNLSKADAPEVWSLFSALAELTLTVAGAPLPLLAIAKLLDSIGDIGAKKIAALAETAAADAGKLAAEAVAPAQLKPLNLRAMLDALGIRAIEMDAKALVTVLKDREFRAQETAIHLCSRVDGSLIRDWFPGEWTRIQVLYEAKLSIWNDPGGIFASVNFGPVKLKGKYATNYGLTVCSERSGKAARRISVSVAGAIAPHEMLRITMSHEKDLQRQLAESGIRLTKGSKLAGFVIQIDRSHEKDPSTDYTRKCVLVLEGES